MIKKEQFAVSLRNKKKSQILSKKRKAAFTNSNNLGEDQDDIYSLKENQNQSNYQTSYSQLLDPNKEFSVVIANTSFMNSRVQIKLIHIFNNSFKVSPNNYDQLNLILQRIICIYNQHNPKVPSLQTYTEDNLFVTNLAILCHKLNFDLLNPIFVRVGIFNFFDRIMCFGCQRTFQVRGMLTDSFKAQI